MPAFCPYCGAEVDPATAAPGGLPDTLLCPVCGQEQDRPAAGPQPPLSPPPLPTCDALASLLGHPEPPPPPPPAGPGPAWEGEGGLLKRLWRSTWQVMGHPGRVLAGPGRPELSWCLSYGLVVGTFSSALTLMWGLVLGESTLSTRGALWLLFLAPLITLAGLFIKAGVLHAMLFILGGAKHGFKATFRVNAYGEAAGILALLPAVGTAAVIVWNLVILTAGLAAAHGIGKGRAFCAMLLPLLLVLLLVLLAVTLLGLTALWAVLAEIGKAGGLGL
ncbi:MAG: YIP1 family protein [Desulfarculus sp.]|nr:YIP1 family protein [Desulfarculus sp.]